jgi:predicted RecB family nuclease
MPDDLQRIADLLRPIGPGERCLQPSALGRYISADQCQRLFRLDLYSDAQHTALHEITETRAEFLSPSLVEEGKAWEREVEDALKSAGWMVTNLEGSRNSGLAHYVYHLVDAGDRQIVMQSELNCMLGGWSISAKPDLVVIDKTIPDVPRLLIADLKSSCAVKFDHRLQVALYGMMAKTLFPEAEITQAVLYREPIDPDETWTDEERAHREAARDLLGLDIRALLAVADRPYRYEEQIQRTVLAPDSPANRIADAPFFELPYHLASKCDGCRYNEFCLRSARETHDLSLIPFMTERSKGLLSSFGVRTIDQLRTVENSEEFETLQVTPSLGFQLDALVRRAEAFTQWQAGKPVDTRLPERGYSSLPAANPDLHANLIRVFIDIQRDVSQGRVYLLGALISCLADGREESAREECVVKMAERQVANDADEADLVRAWIRDVLITVQRLMSPNKDGHVSAPIHFYVWDRAQISALQDLVNRQGQHVMGIEALMALIMQPAAFESDNFSALADEVEHQRAFPILCQSLQAVSSYLGYPWPGALRTQFQYRMFDALSIETSEQGAHLVPERSRFGSEIPTEYAHRAWGLDTGDQDDPEAEPRRSWNRFSRPSIDQLTEFQGERLAALKFVAGRLRTNRQTTKSEFNLDVLSRLTFRPDRPIEAIREFLSLERHTELSAWRKVHSLGLDARVKLGETLVARFHDEDQAPEARTRMREARRREAERQALGAAYADLSDEQRKELRIDLEGIEVRLRIDPDDLPIPLAKALLLSRRREGDFVVLAPAESVDQRPEAVDHDPFQTTARQILSYHGRGVITKLTPDGVIELTLNGGRRGTTGFVWGPHPKPLDDGVLVTIDDNPDSWPMDRQWRVIEAVRDGRPHAGYDWLAEAIRPLPTWTEAEAAAQARFMNGLSRFGEFDPTPSRYEPAKWEFIGEHGDAPMMLVQGPPGTGTSTTTGWAVWSRIQGALASGREFRIAVACKTHQATDVLLEAILKAKERLNDIALRDPEFFEAYFDRELLDVPVFRFEPRKDRGAPSGCRDFTAKSSSAKLNEARKWNQAIVGATTNGHGKLANDHWRDGNPVWDLLVLDEASQMSVPEFLVSAIGLKRDGRIIVVGDHRQMPPIVHQNWEEGETQTLDPYAMYRSIFDIVRFDIRPRIDIKFQESFRIHRDVAEYLRDQIYAEDGIDFHSRKQTLFTGGSEDDFAHVVIRAPHPLILVIHSEHQSQQRNLLEQELTRRILFALREVEGDKPAGVVVPHRAQRADLQTDILARTGDQGLADSVDTVERFQGDERQVIIYSATESDPAYLRDTGAFLFDPRRLTVAISRAKTKLIVIASESVFAYFPTDEASLNNSALWRNLREKACTITLWHDEIMGHQIEVRANPPLAPDRPLPE